MIPRDWIEAGMGMLPTTGRYTTEVYARLMGVDQGTIQKYIQQHNIPHKRFGRAIYVDAADMWDAVPYHDAAAE